MDNPSFFARKSKYLLFPFIILFMGLLSIYGIKGIYSRYAQDDYCYGYRVREAGFWDTQIRSYFHKAEYVSNRFSTTLTQSVVEKLGGPSFVPFLTSLEILAWLGSLIYVLFQIQTTVHVKKSISVILTSALVILFFTLSLAPEKYQLLFWLSANQTYLAPMILATLLLGRFLSIAKSPTVKVYFVIELSLVSFFACGFSETTAIWQFICWCLIFGWSILPIKKPSGISPKIVSRYALVTLFSSTAGLLALALSPSNLKAPNWALASLPSLLGNSLVHGAEFFWYALKGTPIPFAALACFGFLLCSLVLSGRADKPGNYLIGILVIFAVTYVLAVANMIPIKLAETTISYPGERSLFPAKFSLIVCFFVTGWKMAGFFQATKPNLFLSLLAQVFIGLLSLLLFIYIARTTSRVTEKLPLYEARAAAWDQRQQMILEARAEGETDIIIPQFDSVYGITEIKPDPKNWINICAARYYGANSITAVEDYLGISTFPIGK